MKTGELLKWGLIALAVYLVWQSGMLQALLPTAAAAPAALPPGYDPVAAAQAAVEGT